MSTKIIHSDQSTWLAARHQQAKELGPPQPPKRVALPGAKASIDREYLEAHQGLGRSQYAIVEHVNAKWEAENDARLSAHGVFVRRYRAHVAEWVEQQRERIERARPS